MSNDGEEMRFRGVRKRKWGKYVAEIRSGKRSRISLCSYFTPQAAARAYDTALLCLRGPNATFFNFPDSQFNSTSLEVEKAQNNPSPDAIRTAAIAIGSAFDTIRARYFHNNSNEILEEDTPNADKHQSVQGGETINDQRNAVVEEKMAEEEQEICESSDALLGPNASSFNFSDSQFSSTASEMAAAETNPSPDFIRTAVGFAFDAVPARYHDNVEAASIKEKEASTHFGQRLNDQEIADRVEEEENMCEVNDSKHLLQSPEELSFEERVQMSLLLPEDKEMIEPFYLSEIFPDFPAWDETIFHATPGKPPS